MYFIFAGGFLPENVQGAVVLGFNRITEEVREVVENGFTLTSSTQVAVTRGRQAQAVSLSGALHCKFKFSW